MKPQKLSISSYQLFTLVINFVLGSSIILQNINVAGRDTWISQILATISGLAGLFLYTQLSLRFPGKTLIEYLKEVFGKPLGILIGIMYLWYFLHLGSLVLRNYGDFLTGVVLPETPLWFFLFTYALAIAYMVSKGIEVMARVSELMFPLVMIVSMVISVLISLSTNVVEVTLTPIFEKGLLPVILGTVPITSFPFLELVIFTMIFPTASKPERVRKIAMLAVFIGGLFMLEIIIQNLMVYGEYMATLIYPRYFVARMISIGEFIQRIEAVILGVWLVLGMLKIGACLYAFVLGFGQLTGMKNHTSLALPASVLMASTALVSFETVIEMLNFAINVYPIYAFPFQVLFPILIFIVAIIRGKGAKKGINKSGSKAKKAKNMSGTTIPHSQKQ